MGKLQKVSTKEFKGASVLSASANEKMLKVSKRFDRHFMSTKADMGAHASTESYVMKGSAAHANGLPG